MVISVSGYSAALRVQEEGLQSRTHWDDQHRAYSYDYRLGRSTRKKARPLSEYEAGATGRLVLELVGTYTHDGRPISWADRKSWSLEQKLPELLRELEVRAAEREHQRLEAEREAVERERAWQVAM